MLAAIDNLGRINEAYGFNIADEVIAAVATRIRSQMRGKDHLGRFSGNKFGIILNNCTPDDMLVAADRLLVGARDHVVQTSAGPVAVTVTIGGVTAPRHARTVNEVLARAQDALDSAKAKRRGSFQAYQPNPERDAQRQENVRATDEIIKALNERRCSWSTSRWWRSARAQPAFYECLMRVRRDDGSLLAVNEVVPLAERLGLVRLLDHRVLELVLDELVGAPGLQGSAQRVGRLDRRSGLVGVARRRRCARNPGIGRAAHRRDHRNDRDPGHRRHPRLRRAREGSRLPHRDRRFRRRLHVVPQPAQARRRHRQDRRRVRAEPQAAPRTTAPSCRR